MPEIFTDHGPRVFLVAASTTGLTPGNAEIHLSEGDVLGLVDTPDPREATTRVKVLSASGPGSPWGSVLLVNTEDLVESLNHMQATVDQGLEKLQADRAKSGKGPAAFPLPPADAGKDAAFLKDAKADPRAVADFTSAAKEADRDEKAALALGEQVEAPKTMMQMAGFDDQDRWAAAARVKVHMDVEEVDRLLGRPDRLASGLDKKTYIYINGHMKINFFEDKVTEIVRW